MLLIITLILSFFMSLFSTTVMSYIAMATPIGPWIAPTVVLCTMLAFKFLRISHNTRQLSLIASASSVGGILATACGFSFPTLYFLNPSLFDAWMVHPLYFFSVIAGLSLAAGLFGIAMANILENKLIIRENLAFPIGQLVYKMIAAGDQVKKAYELLAGAVSTIFFCVFRDGIFSIPKLFPATITLLHATSISFFSLPLIRFDLEPMYWAIGFITGHMIAIPLFVGALAKIVLIDPVNTWWFAHLSSHEFVLAFCSGMVVQGVLSSFTALPSLFMSALRWVRGIQGSVLREVQWDYHGILGGAEFIGACVVGAIFLLYFGFSWLSILFLYGGACACVYQLAIIAGKIGIAPLGRFATFVMIPAMLLFRLNEIQIVLVATFVEIAGGVAVDILFGRKLARMANIEQNTIKWYQYGGLLISALSIGVIFWLLISHLHLGSAQLFAYKAQSRALLIHAHHFDVVVLVIGAAFSFFLSRCKVNSVLALGGILMPINISLGLIFGGILAIFSRERASWEPFWSGVFAANSIWMLFRTMLG